MDWAIFAGYLVPFIGFLLMAIVLYKRRFRAGALVVIASSLVFGGAGLVSSALSNSTSSGEDGFLFGAILIPWFVSFAVGLFYVEIVRVRNQRGEESKE